MDPLEDEEHEDIDKIVVNISLSCLLSINAMKTDKNVVVTHTIASGVPLFLYNTVHSLYVKQSWLLSIKIIPESCVNQEWISK